MEHRQAHREHVDIPVLLGTCDGVTRRGSIKDLSATGAGVIMTSGSFTHGTVVELKQLSPQGTLKTQRLCSKGLVVWARNRELGLFWLSDETLSTGFQSLLKASHDDDLASVDDKIDEYFIA